MQRISTDSNDVRQRRSVDPIMTLQVPADTTISERPSPAVGRRSSVSAVCFLQSNNSDTATMYGSVSDSDSSDSDEKDFRCSGLVRGERRHDKDVSAGARDLAVSMALHGTFLASSHANSDAFIWDLGRQRVVASFGMRRGPGLALRRLDSGPSGRLLFHTRDEAGTVSIHDVNRADNPIVSQYETYSITFCPAAPCIGNGSLVVLPEGKSHAVIRDIRISETSEPVCRLHGAALDTQEDDKHGMLTSIAMAQSESTNRICVASGMESGSVFFHDLSMRQAQSRKEFCSLKVGKEPVLGMDLTPSPTTSTDRDSFVAVTGMAGDAVEMSELPVDERSTVAVIKASLSSTDESKDTGISARLRARLNTCDVGGPEDVGRSGKPGVGICRFRSDGRCFAVGGWDKRLRIFARSGKSKPLAILKSHADSVTAFDWAPNVSSGLIATGAGDGRIPIWRCFSSQH